LVETAAGDARRTARRIEGAAAVTFMEAPMACERAEGWRRSETVGGVHVDFGIEEFWRATPRSYACASRTTRGRYGAREHRDEVPRRIAGGRSRRAGEDRGVPAWLFARV
jgi:hypothetical protein